MNEADYRSFVLNPLLREKLGYPWRPDVIKHERIFKAYGRSYKTDTLIEVNGYPSMIVEAKPQESQFDSGLEQAKFYAKNYQEGRVVPYIMVAAGDRFVVYRAVPGIDGLGVEFKQLDSLISWSELQNLIKGFIHKPTGDIKDSTVEQIKYVFEELNEAISSSIRPRYSKDRCLIIINELLFNFLQGRPLDSIYRKNRTINRIRADIEKILRLYDLGEIDGTTLAYSFREFIDQNKFYLGTSEDFTIKGDRGKIKFINIARYLTPAHVIKFMVKLVEPDINDKIIDFACGSGGFLGAILSYFKDDKLKRYFIRNNLFGIDIDYLSVSTSRTIIGMLISGKEDNINIFHHNGLYSEKILEYEDNIAGIIKDNGFDIIIGNPPGNASYNGNDLDYIVEHLGLESEKSRFSDGELFLKRAVALAKPSGKICILVPDGILANSSTRYIRDSILKECQIEAIISIPRIFRNVSSKMCVLYMTKNPPLYRHEEIFLTSANLDPKDETANVETELNKVYKEYENFRSTIV